MFTPGSAPVKRTRITSNKQNILYKQLKPLYGYKYSANKWNTKRIILIISMISICILIVLTLAFILTYIFDGTKQRSIKDTDLQIKSQHEITLIKDAKPEPVMNLDISQEILNDIINDNVIDINELQTKHVETPYLLRKYTVISDMERYYNSKIKRKNSFNYLISNEKYIEIILPENELKLNDLFNDYIWLIKLLPKTDANYWNFLIHQSSDEEHIEFIHEFKDKLITNKDKYIENSNNKRRGLSIFGVTLDDRSYFDINGVTGDLYYFHNEYETIGYNNEYWYASDYCVQHKSCTMYPHLRVLSNENNMFTCNDIITKILPQVYQCVKDFGDDCDMIIDSGYYRVIYEVINPLNDKEKLVMKVLTPKSMKKGRDSLRHIRESILLNYLNKIETNYIDNHGGIFKENLNGIQVNRAFNYVKELGHCVSPVYISISKKYKTALDIWIYKHANDTTINQLLNMGIQVAQGIELLHTIPGGPYHHTDIQPRQFLVDDDLNVYINDFNRGKFQTFYFDKNGNNNIKCNYCGHKSQGHWRAPEEPIKYPLNEKLDIFSIGLTIWSLFSTETPFDEANFKQLKYIYGKLRSTPYMTSNIFPALKQVIRQCLSFEPSRRPTASELVEMLLDIKFNIKKLTENKQDIKSGILRDKNTWPENYYNLNYKKKSKQK